MEDHAGIPMRSSLVSFSLQVKTSGALHGFVAMQEHPFTVRGVLFKLFPKASRWKLLLATLSSCFRKLSYPLLKSYSYNYS